MLRAFQGWRPAPEMGLGVEVHRVVVGVVTNLATGVEKHTAQRQTGFVGPRERVGEPGVQGQQVANVERVEIQGAPHWQGADQAAGIALEFIAPAPC